MKHFKINHSYEQDFKNLWTKLQNKYSEEVFDIDGVGEQLDLAKYSRDFFGNTNQTTTDKSVDGNSNVTDNSIISYANEYSKPVERLNAYYLIWKKIKQLYGKEEAEKIIESNLIGDMYINDFHGISTGKPYCYNFSTNDIALQGLPFITKIKSYPPKYLYGFKSQLEQFIIIASNSTLGATGIADLLIVMSLYIDNILENQADGHFKFASQEDCWIYARETLASLIYTLNQPLRGSQSPFTNISLYDKFFAEELCSSYYHPVTFKKVNFDTLNKLQELYVDVMNEELKRTPITFPVTTACFSTDENNNIKDEAFLNMISEKSKEFAFINFYIGKSSTLSSCCRLRSDMKNEYFNAFGSGGTKIGSLGVCTINYPRIAFKHKGDKKSFLKEVEEKVNLSFKVNYAKRKILEDRINGGFHPLYDFGFINLKTQYLTHGVNGFNEMIEIMGYNPLEKEGIDFGIEVIHTINKINDTLSKHFNVPTNCEQIPAETVSVKLAQKDKYFNFNKEYKLYSNQFIPLVSDADLLDRIKLQGIYDKEFSGGSIAHLNVGQKIDDSSKIKNLIIKSAKSGVIYFAINYLLLELEDGSMVVGNKDMTEVNGKKVINSYTRVVGFLTNTKHWNKVRREVDLPNRKFYSNI